MIEPLAATLYALLVAPAAACQLALTLGAPWGALTMGGRWPGRLPPRARALAALQCGALAAMAATMLWAGHAPSLAHVPAPPRAMVLAVVALTAVSALANAITPSVPERRLWMPVTAAMLVAALVTVA